MWGGLWLLSVCQALLSWRTQGQGLEEITASWAGGPGLVSAFGGPGASAQRLRLNSRVRVAGVGIVCVSRGVQKKRKDRK